MSSTLHSILHHIVLHYIVLHPIVLHYIVLHHPIILQGYALNYRKTNTITKTIITLLKNSPSVQWVYTLYISIDFARFGHQYQYTAAGSLSHWSA